MFSIGKTYSTTITVDEELIRKFADFSGDLNPIHVQADAAKNYGHAKPVAHGAILVAILSRLIGMEIPGPGAIWLSQNIQWLQPVYKNDRVTVILEVSEYSKGAALLTLETKAFNQNENKVMEGIAKVKVGQPLHSKQEKKMKEKGTALVTGGSKGIGLKISEHLAQLGYDIAIIYGHNSNDAKQAEKQIKAYGRKCTLIQADLSQPIKKHEKKIKSINDITAFIHCASPAISPVTTDQNMTETANNHWKIACHAPMEIIPLILPTLEKNGAGRLIFMGTSAIKDTPLAGWAPYLSAKHALWGYVRNLATETGPKGITANMISPSMVITDLTADIPHRAKEVEARKNPVRRLATPEDIASTVAYLCNTEASFINGQNIFLTGGA